MNFIISVISEYVFINGLFFPPGYDSCYNAFYMSGNFFLDGKHFKLYIAVCWISCGV